MNGKRSLPLLFAVLLLVVLSAFRSAVYETEVTLYTDVAAKSPDKSRPHNNLGNALKEAGRIPEAQSEFERALEIEPNYPDALNNLGTIYASIGRKQEGINMMRRALDLNPGHLQARFNLAMQYYENGLTADAGREYRLLIQISPLSKEAVFARKMLAMIARR